MYLIALVFFIILWRNDHRNVWALSVRHLPSPSPKSALSSEPPSPVLPRFSIRELPGVVVPIPGPVTSHPEVFHRQSYGVGLPYTIEPYQPQVPPVSRHVQTAEMDSEEQPYPSSFYPQLVQNALQDIPEARVPVRPTASVQRSSSPPPLGDWPRRDVLEQPARPKLARNSSRTMPASHISSRPSGPRTMPLG